MIVVIFLSGSRKAFYGVVIFYIVLILLNIEKLDRKKINSILTAAIVLIIVGCLCAKYLFPLMNETSLYQRLLGSAAESAEASDEGRWELYITAFKDFLAHPLVGLGFNNYDYMHANYSHSTYVEPLACSGCIGFLYLYPYYMLLKNQWKLVRYSGIYISREESRWQKLLFAFYIMFLFIGVGIPYMYKDVPCIILGMLLASQYLDLREMRYAMTI